MFIIAASLDLNTSLQYSVSYKINHCLSPTLPIRELCFPLILCRSGAMACIIDLYRSTHIPSALTSLMNGFVSSKQMIA